MEAVEDRVQGRALARLFGDARVKETGRRTQLVQR